MESLVTLLFLILWVVVAYFVLRYFGQRYFHEPRRADVAAIGVAVAFALGVLWPYSARGTGPSTTTVPSTAAATGAPAQQTVTAEVLGAGAPPGAHDVSATCASATGNFRQAANDGSIDDMRSDAHQSNVVANGGAIDRKAQYLVEGWAAEPAAARPALGVCLLIDGKVEKRAKPYFGLSRPDLETGFHHEELVPSGYLIVIPPGLIPRGNHRIEVLAHLASGKLLVLPARRDVTAN
jgi:hypothetical protein